tara:strand:- start:697 stop:1218 length:522 start_codon:yes stop_codon:yes gene_type:complete
MGTTRTDWRKFRKSTHLASADLDILKSEGKSLVFNIKEVKYQTKVNVSGTKMDGFFCYFKEPIKSLKLNTSNLLVLSNFVKNKGIEMNDIYVVENYKDLIIELFVDRNVKFMGDIVDGVRINPVQPKEKVKPLFTEANFEKAKGVNATIEQIKKAYVITKEIETKYLEYGTEK